MSISAANVAPAFDRRRALIADDLRRLQEPAVICEYEGTDSDGAKFFAYTVAGWLDGQNVATIQGGCTVGGEVILIGADTRAEADDIAVAGLDDTIRALDKEADLIENESHAIARLESVGPVERLRQAMKPASEKSDQFVEDAAAIAPREGLEAGVSTQGKAH